MNSTTARTAALAGAVVLTFGVVAGAQAHDGGAWEPEPAPPGAAVAQDARAQHANVVDITVTGHAIEMPETIPSGWTTFRFHNADDEVHFGLVGLLPDGLTVLDSIEEVVPVFQDGLDLIVAGEPAAGFAEFARLPAWFPAITYNGGPGLTAPGETAVTTVYLEPGTYQMECYVRTDGVFHTTHGMITGFEVTEEQGRGAEPGADVTVTVSSDGVDDGSITVDGAFRPGRQTVAVELADQAVHGNVLGHDLHIARVHDDSDLDELATWMSWISGLEGEAPVEFLGGTHEIPVGTTAYVEVTLTPGEYVLVAEVDDPASKGLLRTIEVP